MIRSKWWLSGLALACTGLGIVAIREARAAEPELVFAKVPSDGSPEQLSMRYSPLAAALGRALGHPVQFQTRGTYDLMSRAMGEGRFDVVSVGPALYLEHEHTYEPVARPVRFGRDRYRGILLVPASSPARKVADLRGKTIGFVSPSSTSGYLLPTLLLAGAGLREGKDYAPAFFEGKHTKVAESVTRGEIDAGCTYDDARLDAFGADRQEVARTRVLAATGYVPNDPIVVRKGLSMALKRQIARFFVEEAGSPEARALRDQMDERISGWVPARSADYDEARGYRAVLQSQERRSPR